MGFAEDTFDRGHMVPPTGPNDRTTDDHEVQWRYAMAGKRTAGHDSLVRSGWKGTGGVSPVFKTVALAASAGQGGVEPMHLRQKYQPRVPG